MHRTLSFFRLIPWLITTTLLACAPAEPEAEPAIAETGERQSAEVIDAATLKQCPSRATNIKYERELVITDAPTLSSKCRTKGIDCTDPKQALKWNFMYLMRQAAGGAALSDEQVSDFILNWLYSYTDSPTVNGQKLENRSAMLTQVINPWRRASGCSTDRSIACTLRAEHAPLRLHAIINRMDTRKGNSVYYGDGLAGEGRMVFGFVDALGSPLKASVILEYNLPAIDDHDVATWARRWHALYSLDPMNSEYGDKLLEITELFAGSGVDKSQSMNNGSALGRLRSSEIAFADPAAATKYHEFREFQLGCPASNPICPLKRTGLQLQPVPTAQTPHNKYLDPASKFPAELLKFVEKNTPSILTETHTVPTEYLAGAAQTLPGAFAIQWYFIPTQNKARRLFALSTCNGCHFKETQADIAIPPTGFMIDPKSGKLDRFLTDEITVEVPLETTVKYNERLRRECEFSYLLDGNTSRTLTNGSGRPH